MTSRREELLDLFDHKCRICGYDRCDDALHFHHIDRSEKSRYSSGKTYAAQGEVRNHPERFELLCANCHAETHHDEHMGRRTFLTCNYCGEEFHLKQSARERKGYGQYCSRPCAESDRTRKAIDGFNARFWSLTTREGDCLIWTGALGARGYGGINVVSETRGKNFRSAHHVAYDLTHPDSPLPKHSRLIQTCGNRLCVEPAHLSPVINRRRITLSK